jgi:hypothetical protein
MVAARSCRAADPNSKAVPLVKRRQYLVDREGDNMRETVPDAKIPEDLLVIAELFADPFEFERVNLSCERH